MTNKNLVLGFLLAGSVSAAILAFNKAKVSAQNIGPETSALNLERLFQTSGRVKTDANEDLETRIKSLESKLDDAQYNIRRLRSDQRYLESRITRLERRVP
ncbi:MAG: hypothetical protein AAB091_04035 [Elusimicrobiota bacterium]